MSRLKSLFTDTVALSVGKILCKLVSYVLLPFYTLWLNTEEYSIANNLETVADFLIPLVSLGLTAGIFRFVFSDSDNKKAVLSTAILLLLGGFVFLLAVSPISLLTPYASYTVILILYVITADVQSIFSEFVRGEGKTKLYSLQGIVNTLVLSLSAILYLRVFRLGITGYLLAIITGNVIASLFLFFTGKLWRFLSFSACSLPLSKQILAFSLPLIPTKLCWLVTDLSDRLMLTYFHGEGVNGVYVASGKLPGIIAVFSGLLLQAWELFLCKKADLDRENGNYYTSFLPPLVAVSFVGGNLLIALTPLCVSLFLATGYETAVTTMPLLVFSAVLTALVSFLSGVYTLKMKSTHSLVTALSGAMLNIALNLILIPRYQGIGAAVATVCSYLLVLLLRVVDTPHLLPFRIPRLLLLFNCLLTGVSAFCVAFFQTNGVPVALLVFFLSLALNGIYLWRKRKRIAPPDEAPTE